MSLEIPHTLDKDEAKRRIELLTQRWASKHGVQSTWNGDSVTLNGKVMGITLEGVMQVMDKKISGEATDPGMLLRGQAKKYVERKFGDYLDPAKSVADLQKSDD
jgi:hypothetical protein